MAESDKKSIAEKERDYKYHKINFRKLIEEYGAYFHLKENNEASQQRRPAISGGASSPAGERT